MTTVTGLTAARMLLIEAMSIVDGVVSGDNLILTRHDGTEINAGNVRGEQGIQGIPGSIEVSPAGGDLTGNYPDPELADGSVTTAKIGDGQVTAEKLAAGAGTPEYVIPAQNSDDPATSFPVGVTHFEAEDAPDGGLGYPAGTVSSVVTYRSSNTSVIQYNTTRESDEVYVRGLTSDGSAWTAWKRFLNEDDFLRQERVDTIFTGVHVVGTVKTTPVTFVTPFPPGTLVTVILSVQNSSSPDAYHYEAASVTETGFEIKSVRNSGTGSLQVGYHALARDSEL